MSTGVNAASLAGWSARGLLAADTVPVAIQLLRVAGIAAVDRRCAGRTNSVAVRVVHVSRRSDWTRRGAGLGGFRAGWRWHASGCGSIGGPSASSSASPDSQCKAEKVGGGAHVHPPML